MASTTRGKDCGRMGFTVVARSENHFADGEVQIELRKVSVVLMFMSSIGL